MALLLVIGGSRFIGADLSQVLAGNLECAEGMGVAPCAA
jgi:hypothetical protein